MKKQKTGLEKAYKKIAKLKIETTTEQYIALTNVLYELANEQFDKGMKIATEIYTK